MTETSNTISTHAQIKATGPASLAIFTHHMLEHGLGAPHTITLDEHGLRLSLWQSDATRWLDTVHVLDETITKPIPGGELERVEVDAVLPTLGVRVQLRFSRRAIATTLHAVSA